MKKSVIGAFLALCLLLNLAPAARAAARGTLGSLSWSLSDDGTLTIGGIGAIPDYNKSDEAAPTISNRPWAGLRAEARRLVVQSGVTRVGSRAFQGFEKLESVELADSVESIGIWAFQNCYALGSVQMPEYIAIELGAFRSAPVDARLVSADGMLGSLNWALSAVGTLTVAGSGAIPDYNKSDEAAPTIANRPWAAYRTLVKRLVVQNGVTRVGSRAFQNFERMESAELADSVTSVGIWAFQNCYALRDVKLSSAAFLDTGAFRDAPVFAAPAPAPTPAPEPDAVSVTVNGTAVQWTDAAPFTDTNGRTMVPLRAAADALGLSVAWDGETREASFSDGGKTLFFPIGSAAARTSGGEEIPMDTAAVIVNDRAYAPVRCLAEYFGYTVDWDGASRTVIIQNK